MGITWDIIRGAGNIWDIFGIIQMNSDETILFLGLILAVGLSVDQDNPIPRSHS